MASLKYLLIALLLIILNASAITGGSDYEETDKAILARWKRQDEGGLDDESKALVCDFGSGTSLEYCSWWVPSDAHANVRWRTGNGALAYWLGGPLVDKTGDGDASGKNEMHSSLVILLARSDAFVHHLACLRHIFAMSCL